MLRLPLKGQEIRQLAERETILDYGGDITLVGNTIQAAGNIQWILIVVGTKHL